MTIMLQLLLVYKDTSVYIFRYVKLTGDKCWTKGGYPTT